MAVDWSVYDDEMFTRVEEEFLPKYGEGETKPEQIITAMTKLVYKWYNDGDVFDNTYALEGWANDLSSYANWLYRYVPETRSILLKISDCYNDSDYEDLLYDLAETLSDFSLLDKYSGPKVGSIYDCKGPFKFDEYREDEDEYDEDAYPYEDEYDEEEEIEDEYDEDIESAQFIKSKKPRDWNTMFTVKVIDAYKKGELTLDNIAEWETKYNGGVRPNPPFNTKEILQYHIKTGEDPRR